MTERVRALGSPAPPVYVHVDLDVLDPTQARANQYAPAGGLSPRTLADTLEALTATTHIYALAVTAYDPAFDRDGRACKAAVEAVLVLLRSDVDRIGRAGDLT